MALTKKKMTKRGLLVGAALSLVGAACSPGSTPLAQETSVEPATTAATEAPAVATTTTQPSITGLPITSPDWLYTRVLETTPNGFAAAQPTPAELIDRKLPPREILPLPTSEDFKATISPFDGEPLARSTWNEDCPVSSSELRYITVTFWGFDERPHLGEMVLNQDVALDVVRVFRTIYEARFPIEEMRITEPWELDAPPTGDGNNSASFVCRAVTGGNKFSQHAFGLAIDINPFHNPYHKNDVVLPELATAYLDRDQRLDGMLFADSTPVEAFAEIGWGWGGQWNSLKDYQHFSSTNR